jgi:hypothetical protein
MSYLRYKNLAWYRDDRAEAVRRREEDVNLQINFQVAKLSVIVRDGMEKANGRARHREIPGRSDVVVVASENIDQAIEIERPA